MFSFPHFFNLKSHLKVDSKVSFPWCILRVQKHCYFPHSNMSEVKSHHQICSILLQKLHILSFRCRTSHAVFSKRLLWSFQDHNLYVYCYMFCSDPARTWNREQMTVLRYSISNQIQHYCQRE